MANDIRDQLFRILTENADQLEDPPVDDDERQLWVDDLHREAEEAASDFSLQYRRAHTNNLGDDAATYHDRIATLRAEIEELPDDPDPAAVLDIRNGVRELKFDIENLGEQCMIRAGEEGNRSLYQTGTTLAEEADRCWKTTLGPVIEKELDDNRRDPREDAPSLDEAVEQTADELRAMWQNDLPYLMGLLDDARAHL